nr:BatD family protein [Pedosphaera parvula]
MKAGTSSANTNAATARIGFVKLVVPKSQVYLGEMLPLEIQVYLQQQARFTEMPHFKEEGFTLGKMQQPTQAPTVFNNRRYEVITFKNFVVPAKAGKIDIGPASVILNVPRPDSRRTIFGEFVDWEPATLESDPQMLEVLPLPKENVPPGFSGAVGNYSMAVNVSPTNVATGDPITVKAQISGRGSLDSLTLPQQADWNQFKVYPPTSDVQFADQLGMSGIKTFALTVVPESMAIKELPPFSFSYFDPDQKQYRTLTQPAVPLTVRPSAASLPPPNLANTGTESNQPPAKDILHIKPRLGVLSQIQPPLIQRSWFIGLQGVPVLAWISLLVVRKQKEKLANNPRLRRQRQVEKIVNIGLGELRQSAQANEAEAFYATVFRLLQEQIGERLDVPASAITESVVEERLRPRNVPEETLISVHDLFQACNQARYSRHSSNEQLISLIPTVETTLNQLRNIPA